MVYTYSFHDDCTDKAKLGNKGANLVKMTQLEFKIPPGFIVSIEAYKNWQETSSLPDKEIDEALAALEKEIGRKMGKGLEVSVRSSAPVSMPGMMDTLLNIGDKRKAMSAIKRIFESWDSMRAVEYRRLHDIPATLGTAAVVQAMVYGNRDKKSGTGVVFSRNPSTGEPGLFGEYLTQAQGEDLVSGARTPQPITKLKSEMPKIYDELDDITRKLEGHFCEMQDIEFTIESGKLYILQTRTGKRSGCAAVKIAVDMVSEGMVTRDEAIMRVSADDIRGLLHKQIKSPDSYQPIATGLNAAPGAASGKVIFNAAEALAQSKKGVHVILVRPETSPDDIQGIAAADGVLTQSGGLTSHAAIVTRGMGKSCVCGAEGIHIDLEGRQFSANETVVKEGDDITLDGTTGNVYLGVLPVEEVGLTPEVGELMSWADGFKRLGIRANADTPDMIREARKFGAEGIGLCRTERMFNAPERLSKIREYILAETGTQRATALTRLRELQRKDFEALFKELQGIPIIVRLLDIPLHEFLPSLELVKDPRTKRRIIELTEINPMLGHRGVRLAVTNPEIYKMQIEAIDDARSKVSADISIMIPQVITSQEALAVKSLVKATDVKVGVMIETVRACMRAGRLAQAVDFFSFGTNDLTQAVFSFSREDAEKKFLTTYIQAGILQDNPFEVLDVKGVGQLMETAIFWAHRVKGSLEIGVCGEQGGEPRSIRFLHDTGVDYVSCSPFRVPVARLVAAQATIQGSPDRTAFEIPAG